MPWVRRLLASTLVVTVGVGLGWVILSLPADGAGLVREVDANLGRSGVNNPVTAVLLNFRGYDTLLEMGVLLLALLGVWSLSPVFVQPQPSPGAVLDLLVRTLVPVMPLVAGYLLWIGAVGPGGAFQAGAVVAAAGVLVVLAGFPFRIGRRIGLLRALLVLGLSVFVLVGVTAGDARLLEFRPDGAGLWIFLIEAAATLSIGAILTVVFLGGRPTGRGDA